MSKELVRSLASKMQLCPETVDNLTAFAAKHTARFDAEYDLVGGFKRNVAVDDSRFDELIDFYIASGEPILQSEKDSIDERRVLLEMERAREKMVGGLPITSGTNFEGHKIVRYGGYVSGDEVVQLSDSFFGTGFNKDIINNAVKSVRSVAINEMKAAAVDLGCNAVIALDFDYITVDRQYPGLSGLTRNETYIILTANGTAVEIEPV